MPKRILHHVLTTLVCLLAFATSSLALAEGKWISLDGLPISGSTQAITVDPRTGADSIRLILRTDALRSEMIGTEDGTFEKIDLVGGAGAGEPGSPAYPGRASPRGRSLWRYCDPERQSGEPANSGACRAALPGSAAATQDRGAASSGLRSWCLQQNSGHPQLCAYCGRADPSRSAPCPGGIRPRGLRTCPGKLDRRP